VRILLTGKDGQIGWELQRALAPLGVVGAYGRDGLDLRDLKRVRALVREFGPDVIVNAAAYTAVDRAEEEPEVADQVNGLAPGVLAEEARARGALLLHYSTDYVFAGTSERPHTEDDATGPLGAYGRSKLMGERLIAETGAQALIFRTAWVYATRGRSFLSTIQRLARERQDVSVVDDQHGTPTWARMIAEATTAVLAELRTVARREVLLGTQRCCTYHLTCAGETSWYGFARAIIDRMRREQPGGCLATLRPIPTSEYPTKAVRPRYSVLSNTKIERELGVALPRWEEALDLCLLK
jgi:dTDP-4-dehydrorhamnose reductase